MARPVSVVALVAWIAGCSAASSAGSGDGGSPVPSPDGGAPTAEGGGSREDGATGVPDAPTGDSSQPPTMCAPSWTPDPACGGGSTGGTAPDFGPNVLIFDPSMAMSDIQSKLDQVDGQQDSAQFGTGRYAYFFKPGQYQLDVRVGFYTQVLGLGHGPDDVVVTGAVRSKADWANHNATLNFWRGVENISAVPSSAIDGGVNVWAVSQGTWVRRMHVQGSMALSDGGYSSGGFIADSKIDKIIYSGTQQQFLTRNTDVGNWQGATWNMVFVGDGQAPTPSWPYPPYTVSASTPLVREKPFLFVDGAGNYFVMVPALKSNSSASSWAAGAPPGTALSIDRFYIARPDTDTAATINAALAQGKNLILTPGIYHLDASIQVTRGDTVVLGLGLATLIPTSGNSVLSIADVDGVTVGGVLLEAGTTSSPVLLQVGEPGSSADHSAAPTALFDVHCRIGGADPGTAANCVTINSNDVLVDNTWLWRADHGAGVGWTSNMGKNGLIVNGNGVTIYGLFVEHFQEYQTLWNGNGGSVYFYQSEMPYDPPSQSAWQSGPGMNGYASYKVADAVTTHSAEGLGVYSVFRNAVSADNAIETPTASGVSMHHMVTVSLASGTINNIINGTGGSVGNGTKMAQSSQ